MWLNINGVVVLGIGNRIKEKGLTLIEALVSTVIVGIGFIAVFQMVNYSVQSIDVSGERTKGNYLVSMVAEDLMGSAVSTIDITCLLYTSPSPRDRFLSRMPSSA